MRKLVIGSILVLCLLPACGWSAEKAAGGTLIWGRGGDSVSLDLAQATDGESIKAGIQVLENLVIFGKDSMNVEPQLAESWTVSDDGLTWTFKLRKGVKFHDGYPFNARAVYDSFARVIFKQHPYYGYGQWKYVSMSLGPVKDIKVDRRLHDRADHRQALRAALEQPRALALPDPLAQVHGRPQGKDRHPARGHRALQVRELDQGRPDRARAQQRLLGREGQGRQDHPQVDPRALRAPDGAAVRDGRHRRRPRPGFDRAREEECQARGDRAAEHQRGLPRLQHREAAAEGPQGAPGADPRDRPGHADQVHLRRARHPRQEPVPALDLGATTTRSRPTSTTPRRPRSCWPRPSSTSARRSSSGPCPCRAPTCPTRSRRPS